MGRFIARLFLLPIIVLGALLIVDTQALPYRTIEGTVLSKVLHDNGCAAQLQRNQYHRSCHFLDLIDPLSPILVLTHHRSVEVSQHLYPLVGRGDRLTISVSRVFGAIGHVTIMRNGVVAQEFDNAAPRTLTIVGAVLLLPVLLFFVKARKPPAAAEPRPLSMRELEAFRVFKPGRIRHKSLRYSPSGGRTPPLHKIRRRRGGRR